MLGMKVLPFEVMQTGEFWVDLSEEGQAQDSEEDQRACDAAGPVQYSAQGRASGEFQVFCERDV